MPSLLSSRPTLSLFYEGGGRSERSVGINQLTQSSSFLPVLAATDKAIVRKICYVPHSLVMIESVNDFNLSARPDNNHVVLSM